MPPKTSGVKRRRGTERRNVVEKEDGGARALEKPVEGRLEEESPTVPNEEEQIKEEENEEEGNEEEDNEEEDNENGEENSSSSRTLYDESVEDEITDGNPVENAAEIVSI